jgi:hypothetical protein
MTLVRGGFTFSRCSSPITYGRTRSRMIDEIRRRRRRKEWNGHWNGIWDGMRKRASRVYAVFAEILVLSTCSTTSRSIHPTSIQFSPVQFNSIQSIHTAHPGIPSDTPQIIRISSLTIPEIKAPQSTSWIIRDDRLPST